jgi:hypothetical protein
MYFIISSNKTRVILTPRIIFDPLPIGPEQHRG